MSTERDFYKSILDDLYDGVYFVDIERRITYWNRGAERITGFKDLQVLGKRCADNLLMHVDENGNSLCETMCPLTQSMSDGAVHEAMLYLHHANGYRLPVLTRVAPMRDKDGAVIGAVETFSDNSVTIAALKQAQELGNAAMQDALTGLWNRRHMEMKIALLLQESRLSHISTGLLFIDIDHFKQVNDTFGHDMGDKVLQMVADTLRLNLRGSDIVGRWGGEEFVVLVQGVTAPGLAGVAQKLRALTERGVMDHNGQSICVTISIGATLLRDDDSVATVIKRADTLMYESKTAGRNRVTCGE